VRRPGRCSAVPHAVTIQGMRIAILGTRGVPANYGGFETFAEQLGKRLAERGHEVTVYGRDRFVPRGTRSYLGMRIIRLPTPHSKYFRDGNPHALLRAARTDSTVRRRLRLQLGQRPSRGLASALWTASRPERRWARVEAEEMEPDRPDLLSALLVGGRQIAGPSCHRCPRDSALLPRGVRTPDGLLPLRDRAGARFQ
jgi:hypothetical protein